MNRAHATRGRMQPPLPKFWRKPLAPSQKMDAKIIHHDLVSRFERGEATADDLWDWMETGFTYTQILRLLHEDGTTFTDEAVGALQQQIDSYAAVCERLRRTGRVGLSGPELLIARAAAEVMDGLIDMDRHGIAERAAMWSMQQMERIRKAAA